MTKLAAALVALAGLMSACVYEEPRHDYRGDGYYHRDYRGGNYDRDHDGVPNRDDRRPDNPRRY